MAMILKLALAPALIGAVSLAGRRWGPRFEGTMAGLPLTSAPVVGFLAVEQGPTFAARSAEATLRGVAALAAFVAAYGRASARCGWAACSIAGWIAFAAAGVLVRGASGSVVVTSALVVVALALARLCIPRAPVSRVAPAIPAWDVPARMVAAAAMLLLVTGAAASMGPDWSGLLSSTPIFAGVTVAFTHRHGGAAAAAQALRGLCAGLLSFVSFFAVAAAGLGAWNAAAALAAAAGAALATQGAIVFARSRSTGTEGVVQEGA